MGTHFLRFCDVWALCVATVWDRSHVSTNTDGSSRTRCRGRFSRRRFRVGRRLFSISLEVCARRGGERVLCTRRLNVERSDAQAHSHKKGHIMEGSEERGPAPRAVGTCGSLRGCGRASIGAARHNDPTLHNDGLSRLQPRQRARPRGGQRPAASHHAPLRKHAVPRLRPPPSRTRS